MWNFDGHAFFFFFTQFTSKQPHHLCVCVWLFRCVLLNLTSFRKRCHSGVTEENSHTSAWSGKNKKTRMREPNLRLTDGDSHDKSKKVKKKKKKAKNAFEPTQTETNQTDSQKMGYLTFGLCTPNPAVMRKTLNSFSRLALLRSGIFRPRFQATGSNSNSVPNATNTHSDFRS